MSRTYDMRCRKLPLKKALGLYIFVRGFRRAYELNGGLISEGDYNGNGKSCSKQAGTSKRFKIS